MEHACAIAFTGFSDVHSGACAHAGSRASRGRHPGTGACDRPSSSARAEARPFQTRAPTFARVSYRFSGITGSSRYDGRSPPE
jgi:hypothetical protein